MEARLTVVPTLPHVAPTLTASIVVIPTIVVEVAGTTRAAAADTPATIILTANTRSLQKNENTELSREISMAKSVPRDFTVWSGFMSVVMISKM